MSARQSVYRCIRIPVNGGESPNAFVPQITVEVKAFWPPGLGHESKVGDALTRAYTEALYEVMSHHGWLRP